MCSTELRGGVDLGRARHLLLGTGAETEYGPQRVACWVCREHEAVPRLLDKSEEEGNVCKLVIMEKVDFCAWGNRPVFMDLIRFSNCSVLFLRFPNV